MDIFNESIAQKDKFRSAANKLLNSCFIIKKKEDTRNDYIFILQNKEYFQDYFDLLGYKLVINENQGVICLNSITGLGRLRLKKIESILLLILRLLYIEKQRELRLNEDVVVLSDDILEKFSMLKIEAKTILDKTTYRDIIRLFKKYNLVSNIDTDITMSDARLIIYPSILFAVTNENLTNLYDAINDKLNKYLNVGGEQDDEEALQD